MQSTSSMTAIGKSMPQPGRGMPLIQWSVSLTNLSLPKTDRSDRISDCIDQCPRLADFISVPITATQTNFTMSSTYISRLSHGRYNDGNEEIVQYQQENDDSYRIRRYFGGKELNDEQSDDRFAPIPLNEMREALAGQPELQILFDRRLEELQSIISMDFNASETTVSALYIRKEKNGNRYLNEVSACYSYCSFREFNDAHERGGFRAGNGMQATLSMPLYLTQDHANSLREYFHWLFSKLAGVNPRFGNFHVLWVPDTLAHLMNQAIVDFSKGHATEPAVQFVLDAMRLLVYCCEAPKHGYEEATIPERPLFFPEMKPLMMKFVKGFIEDPMQRTRDKVPDLGDLLQWVSVLEMFHDDDGGGGSPLEWGSLIHALIVESTRRQARWICNDVMKAERLRPQVLRRERAPPGRGWSYGGGQRYFERFVMEPQGATVLRYLKRIPKRQVLSMWWDRSKVSCKVLMYSRAFYRSLVEGRGLEGFKKRYDVVLGAAYKEDQEAIKAAQTSIENCRSLSEAFVYLGYPLIDDDIHKLCLWAVTAQAGYHTMHQKDPFGDP